MLRSSALGLAAVLGVLAIGNGVFMLMSPDAWYLAVPGVTATGPFNQHFLRDIGLIFVLLGGAFLGGVARPESRVLLWAAPSLWLGGHALFHFWEVAVGICSPSVHPARFSRRHLAGDHRRGADPLGVARRARRKNRRR